MSNTFPDLDLTKFPDQIDQRLLMIDPSSNADVAVINSYQQAMSTGNFAQAASILIGSTRLQQMIFNAERWQRHDDQIIAIQRVWDGEIAQYIAAAAEAMEVGPGGLLFPDGESLEDKAEVWDDSLAGIDDKLEAMTEWVEDQLEDQNTAIQAQLTAQNTAIQNQLAAQNLAVQTAISEVEADISAVEAEVDAMDAKKQNELQYQDVVLIATDWTAYDDGLGNKFKLDRTVAGWLAAWNFFVMYAPASRFLWGKADISALDTTANGTITFVCVRKPTENVTARLVKVEPNA